MSGVGRPRKDAIVTEAVEVVPTYDRVALSIIREGGKYVLVEIPFDGKTLSLGQAIKIPYDSRYEAEQRFRIAASTNIFQKVES